MKITVDTITDEQIRELRDEADGSAFVQAGEEILSGTETTSLCDEALGDWFPEIDKLRKIALPSCTCESTYEADRVRCPVHKERGGK